MSLSISSRSSLSSVPSTASEIPHQGTDAHKPTSRSEKNDPEKKGGGRNQVGWELTQNCENRGMLLSCAWALTLPSPKMGGGVGAYLGVGA